MKRIKLISLKTILEMYCLPLTLSGIMGFSTSTLQALNNSDSTEESHLEQRQIVDDVEAYKRQQDELEQKRLENTRINNKVQDQYLEDRRVEQKRVDNSRLQRQIDDKRWSRDHNR